MSNHKLFSNFITLEECDDLANWITQNYNANNLVDMTHPGTIRKSTRFSKDIIYPDTAFIIQSKIDKILKSMFRMKTIKKVPSFYKGMYASYGTVGDACEAHRDPVWFEDTKTYHFNIMLSDYTGARLIIENDIVDLKKLDGILYPVSEVTHSTTELTGNQPRLFWCFGYSIAI